MKTEFNKNINENNKEEIKQINEENNKDEDKEENKAEDKEEIKKKNLELIKKREEAIKEELIDIVIRQTTYSREEAIKNLEKNKYDFSKVIREFLNPDSIKKQTEEKKKINIQQEIYKEIRNMMNSASRKQRQIAELNKNQD